MAYVLHPEVYGDLDEIYEYIDNFNHAAADRVLDEFLAASIRSFAFHFRDIAAPIFLHGLCDSKSPAVI